MKNVFFQSFSGSMSSTDKRMTAERCARLSLVAIAHGIEEAWIAIFPVVPIQYANQYFPALSKK